MNKKELKNTKLINKNIVNKTKIATLQDNEPSKKVINNSE